jgi:hypothetical protein
MGHSSVLGRNQRLSPVFIVTFDPLVADVVIEHSSNAGTDAVPALALVLVLQRRSLIWPIDELDSRSRGIWPISFEIEIVDVEQLFVEFVERVASETGFACTGGTDEERILRCIVFDNGLEGGGEPIHLLVSVDDLAGDELVLEYPRVLYHIETVLLGIT